MHYLPFTPGFVALFAGLIAVLAALIEIGVLRYTYERLGLSRGGALIVLIGSLAGSYVNIPLVWLPERQVIEGRVVDFFGMDYIVPHVVDWPGTVIAVNLGGAVIPILLSAYLVLRYRIFGRALVATFFVAAVCWHLAQPVPGVGIAVPTFVPPIVTAIVALIVSWRFAAPLAYVSGCLGTLIGADLLNLAKVRGLGAPVASIGGAGTFDGVFLTGIIAVLLASLLAPRPAEAG